MIPTTHQLAAAPRRVEKRLRREQHATEIKAVHEGIDLLPADYLVRNQPSDELRVHRIRAEAKQRQAIRNAKRLKSSLR